MNALNWPVYNRIILCYTIFHRFMHVVNKLWILLTQASNHR